MAMWQKEIETMPREELKKLQSERLVWQVNRMYESVELFRKRMDEMGIKPSDIKSVDDLHKLPFSYKQDLRDYYPYGLFAVPTDDIVRVHASSGTTGKKIVVGYTKNDIKNWDTCIARMLTAIGLTNKDFIQVAFGYGLFTGGFGLHNGAETIGATVIPISSGNTHNQIQTMVDFKATALCCTPSYALYLGETLKEMGYTPADLKLKAGFFGAEPWTEQMRREIERNLGIKAYDIYGLSEISGPGVAFECPEQTGMHINEDHFIVEIIDPDTGEVLPDGEEGEVVFTCITKEAFPLIRYRTRDISVLSHEKCSCGRTLVKMSKPRGRSDDMLIIRGVNVFPSQIESVLLDLGQTAPHYQLIVDRKNNTDTFEILVEMSENMFSDSVKGLEEQEHRIQAAVESTLGIGAKVTLVEPKSIARSEGKAKRVIDKRQLH